MGFRNSDHDHVEIKRPRKSVLDATIEHFNGTEKAISERNAREAKSAADLADRKKAGITEQAWNQAQSTQKEDQKDLDRWLAESKK
jgi:hypothetical protein